MVIAHFVVDTVHACAVVVLSLVQFAAVDHLPIPWAVVAQLLAVIMEHCYWFAILVLEVQHHRKHRGACHVVYLVLYCVNCHLQVKQQV